MCTIRNNLLYYIFSVLCSLTKDSQTECDLAAINCLQYCSRFVSRSFFKTNTLKCQILDIYEGGETIASQMKYSFLQVPTHKPTATKQH